MESDLKKNMAQYLTEEMNVMFNIETLANSDSNSNLENSRLIEVTESIAPYYQLLKEDSSIKHNLYCNIDVGGGTTDIVLVNKNDKEKLLDCYCNSVRFAGRQIWGSVSDDYNSEDNGFLHFYLKLLQSQRSDFYYNVIGRIDGKKSRNEDTISYFLSNAEYNFKQIFTEHKDLKVPLLLHYAALLYFVAKSCKTKPMKLPKTLSFSGKGSEYIGLIFDSDEHLRIFTKKALTLFSGLDADPEFRIKKTRNPKVITAQGSVVYAAKPLAKKEKSIFGEDMDVINEEVQINPIPDKYYGLSDKDIVTDEKKVYGDFEEHKPAYESVMMNCVEFLNTFFSDTALINGSEISLGIENLAKYKSYFINFQDPGKVLSTGILRDSYKSALEEKDLRKEATDSPFFFAFSTSLIALSKHIAKEALKNKAVFK
jgi:hypothetical protein